MLPVFAAGVGARPPDLACEALVDDAAEPCLVELREVDAGDYRPPARSDELTKEELRWLAPDGLNMLKPGGVHAVLVPRPNIGEVNVAENDAVNPSSRSDASSWPRFASISAQVVGMARRPIPIAAACASSISTRVAWKRTRRAVES